MGINDGKGLTFKNSLALRNIHRSKNDDNQPRSLLYITKSLSEHDEKQSRTTYCDATGLYQPTAHLENPEQERNRIPTPENNGPNSTIMDRPHLAQGWGQLKDPCRTSQFLMDISNFFLSRNISPFTAGESLNRFYIWLHMLLANSLWNREESYTMPKEATQSFNVYKIIINIS